MAKCKSKLKKVLIVMENDITSDISTFIHFSQSFNILKAKLLVQSIAASLFSVEKHKALRKHTELEAQLYQIKIIM